MENNNILSASVDFSIRFSEVDSMQIVWHGSYALYAEDAREAFGAKYGIGYLDIYGAGFYAPIVDLQFSYKSPLVYGDRARTVITYIPTAAAKIQFEYEILNLTRQQTAAVGRTTQVFLDKKYQLMLYAPDFYQTWKTKHGLI